MVEVPALAVGGITADRALQITVHGAVGVAVINAIFRTDDPERATRQIADAIAFVQLGQTGSLLFDNNISEAFSGLILTVG